MPAIAKYTKPIQVSLDPKTFESIACYADARKISVSAVVRELIARYLKQHAREIHHAISPTQTV